MEFIFAVIGEAHEMKIEQIKDKLIELGFEREEQILYDQFTGQKLNKPIKFKFIKKNKFPIITVEISHEQFGNNGILQTDSFINLYLHINLYLQNQEDKKMIDFWWNLFLQLLEEHTK